MLRNKLSLGAYEKQNLLNITEGPSTIRAIKIKAPRNKDYELGKCRIIATWDNRWHPSIDAPIDLFFGSGVLFNNDNREYLVKGFISSIRYDDEFIYLESYWPMPFFENARIEIQNRGNTILEDIEFEIRYQPYTDPINHVGYFHASYSDHEHPIPGQEITFLDTRNIEGSGFWSGTFVGMSWIFSHRGVHNVLEGDPRFLFDDSKTPQAMGTGTEEWGGGGDYWGGENMTIPFAGHPTGKKYDSDDLRDEKELINSAYRFLIADHFPFGNRAIIQLEHGAINSHDEHIKGVVYWYGIDAPSLVRSDEFFVCNQKDIKKYNYSSPSAGKPYALVSRYELGPDHTDPLQNKSRMVFPAEEDSVRTMTGISTFTMSIYPKNLGVVLRRKFDYVYPNQHAKVYVKEHGTEEWNYAGEWYTAGSNTSVYSRPRGESFTEAELAPTEHHIITSNRRWREEEFIIGRDLSEGIQKLDIKIEHIPNTKELFPGTAFPEESKWSESRYWTYSYVLPYMHEDISKGAYNPALVMNNSSRTLIKS
jgi:hypothetical protein